MELLVLERRGGLIPGLILYHPSKTVVLRALEIFETAGRKDFVPLADRLRESQDPELRAAALRARTAAQPEETVLRASLEDESPLVRATAAVNLVAAGWAAEGAQALIAPLLASGLPVWRRALARAIERRPHPAFHKTLQQLALSPEADVQASVANALGALGDPRCLGTLLAMLSRHEVRAAAGAAFLRYGEDGLRFLDEALADTSYPHELRRQIPRTIRRFPPREASRVLLRHLLAEQDGMVRFKILRSLNRLGADNPGLGLDRGTLKEAVRRTLSALFELSHWRHLLAEGVRERAERATAGHELLATLLRDKEVHAVERLFRLLGLVYRGEDFQNIHRGVLSADARLRASSRELLEGVLRRSLRGPVLAVADGAPWPARAPHAPGFYEPAAAGYEDLLQRLIESRSETVRCLAAHHVAELGLRQMRPALEARRSQETALFVARVLEKALRVLDGPPREALVVAG